MASMSAAVFAYYPLLTLVELCAEAISADDAEVWPRRAYVWRKLGKILVDGAPFTKGQGPSKRYAAASVPGIAVMLFIASRFRGLEVEVLDGIAKAIEKNLAANPVFARCWRVALLQAEAWYERQDDSEVTVDKETDEEETDGVSRSNTYLSIAFPGPIRDDFIVRCGSGPKIMPGEDTDIYVLDLHYIFANLLIAGRARLGEGFRLAGAPQQAATPRRRRGS
jgi:hypothetical protein